MRGKDRSFKNKVLVPIISVFVISVLVISAINYSLLRSTVKTKANASLELFTNSIIAQSNHLNLILDTVSQTLGKKHLAIAKSIAYILENITVELTIPEAQKLADLLDIFELDVADVEGTIIYSNYEEGYIGWNYNSTEPTKVYMELADGTRTELTEEPRTDEVSGEMKHYVGVSRTDDEGFIQLGFDANVLGKIKEDISIQVTIQDTKIGDNGYGMVLSKGVISAHPNKNMLGKDISNEDWFKTVSEKNGFTWLNIDNVKYYAGFKNADGKAIVGLIPEGDFYKELNQTLTSTIVFMVFAIIIMVIVVYIILGWLLSPIKNLSGDLGKIAKGSLNVSVATGARDEIGQLTRDLAVVVDQFVSLTNNINIMSQELLVNGNMSYKIDSNLYNGDYRKVIDGINGITGDIVNLHLKTEEQHQTIISSINYASKIQKNLLPKADAFKEAFLDYSIIWSPRDIVGGDIYWLKNFEEGSLLCVCDCTGHGAPGAFLTLLVVSALEAVVRPDNCHDTAEIIWQLEQRLVTVFNVKSAERDTGDIDIKDGCDPAVLFIAKDGSVTLSSGNISVFVCDGKEVQRIKGQKIYVGEGRIEHKDIIKTTRVPANPDNKFYVASDGLFDQSSSSQRIPFGYKRFEEIILKNHSENQSLISERVWEAFEAYRGDKQRVDDFELITFRPKAPNRV